MASMTHRHSILEQIPAPTAATTKSRTKRAGRAPFTRKVARGYSHGMAIRRGRQRGVGESAPTGTPRAVRSLAEAEPAVFWLDDPAAPPAQPALVGAIEADLVVVGGGYTGLWTALQAKEADPGRDVVLVEAATVGWAASGRNGGFCASSLTHGEANGLDRFPGEFDTLERLGRENLDGIEATITRHGIDAEFERTGELDIAVEDWQVAELTVFARPLAERGPKPVLLPRHHPQAVVHPQTYLARRYDA